MRTVKLIARSPVFLAGSAAAAVFLLNLQLPNGVLDGVLYGLIILLSTRIADPRATLFAAASVMPVMVMGFIGSPTAAPFWVAITNRGVSVAVVWATAFLIWHHTKSTTAKELPPPDIPQLSSAGVRDDLALQLGIIEWRLQRLPYFAGRAAELKRETLVLSSALKSARHSVRTLEMQAHAPDELTLAGQQIAG